MELDIPDRGPRGTHAFIVGVSHYPFADGPEATPAGEALGLANLSAAARSASEVAAWLLNEYRNPDAPLASLRIHLSPSPGEKIHPDIAALMGAETAPATRDAVEVSFNQFRAACRSDPEGNVAFVYVAGHGIQLNKRGAVVLLHDFATENRDLLYGALDIAGCHAAMDENGNARRQVWFSDACRQRPEIAKKFESLSGGYRPDEGIGQVEASPLFLASSTRESAFAAVDGLTIFSQALLWALRGAGASGRGPVCEEWHVAGTKLISLLPARVRELLKDKPEDQNVDVTGRVLEIVVQRFTEPPEVEVEVELTPANHAPLPAAQLALAGGANAEDVGSAWPLQFRRPAGLYLLKVALEPPHTTPEPHILNVEPPSLHYPVVVS